jgi:hypothetical protein
VRILLIPEGVYKIPCGVFFSEGCGDGSDGADQTNPVGRVAIGLDAEG